MLKTGKLKSVVPVAVVFLAGEEEGGNVVQGKAANQQQFPFLFLCHFTSISSPEVCGAGLLFWIASFSAEDSGTLEAQAWHDLSLDRRRGSGCSLDAVAFSEMAGRGSAGDWCWVSFGCCCHEG